MEQRRNMETTVYGFLESINYRIMFIKECHTTWWYLRSNNPDRDKILDIYNKYLEFFEVIRVSLFSTVINNLSTLFDNDCKSISFKNLIKMVYPNDKPFTSKIINYNELYKKGRRLWDYRSKSIAHCDKSTLERDFLEETNLTYDDFTSMVDDCRKLINEIYIFCGKSIPNYVATNSDVQQLITDLSKMNKNNT